MVYRCIHKLKEYKLFSSHTVGLDHTCIHRLFSLLERLAGSDTVCFMKLYTVRLTTDENSDALGLRRFLEKAVDGDDVEITSVVEEKVFAEEELKVVGQNKPKRRNLWPLIPLGLGIVFLLFVFHFLILPHFSLKAGQVWQDHVHYTPKAQESPFSDCDDTLAVENDFYLIYKILAVKSGWVQYVDEHGQKKCSLIDTFLAGDMKKLKDK